MLLQMCRLCGFSPIVAVVGSSSKVEYCKALGADVVIDKSKEKLWKRANEVCPQGLNVCIWLYLSVVM
jgi:NADPH-dependent curcumin reductase CurA